MGITPSKLIAKPKFLFFSFFFKIFFRRVRLAKGRRNMQIEIYGLFFVALTIYPHCCHGCNPTLNEIHEEGTMIGKRQRNYHALTESSRREVIRKKLVAEMFQEMHLSPRKAKNFLEDERTDAEMVDTKRQKKDYKSNAKEEWTQKSNWLTL